MKISNETKVGVLAVVSISMLIFGFNFLKGKKIFSRSTILYAKYDNILGLQKSNAIIINGLQVGNVYDIRTDKDMKSILVELNITKDVHIPVNSLAVIRTNPLATPSLEILLGDASTHLNAKDSILTKASEGMFDNVLKKVDPVLYEVKKSLGSLDTLLLNFNTILDPEAKTNIATSLKNLNAITASMLQTTASLQIMLNAQTGVMAKTLNNVNSITGNLAASNEKITSVVSNLDKTTEKFSQLDIETTINTLNGTLTDLKLIVGKMNSTDGSLGLMMNDKKLYNNLSATGNKLNLLLDDLRMNPKRYINISVFGKKQNNNPLMVPLPDTLNAPYYSDKVN